ncbi:Ion transport protein-domain-containing protein [Blastocladiella britannica]|nr:Ion transport protein-domain-containing protein [Blastocladiella britannica]
MLPTTAERQRTSRVAQDQARPDIRLTARSSTPVNGAGATGGAGALTPGRGGAEMPRKPSLVASLLGPALPSLPPPPKTRIRRSRIGDDPTETDDLMAELDLNTLLHDLSGHTSIFRTQLIEEFQLLENMSMATGSSAVPPQFNSKDVRDPTTLARILEEAPGQLIKFPAVKRAGGLSDVDRRLTRVKNKGTLPIGAWAQWVVESHAVRQFVLVVILLNAVTVGISAELGPSMDSYPDLFQVLDMIDKLSLVLFLLEIGIQWLDSFRNYWRDPWNVFDFAVTIGTAVPEVLAILGVSESKGSFATVMQQLKTFRILRSLKLAVRFTSLRIIVITILEALRSMALIMMLLFLVFFIFGVIAVYSFSDMQKYPLPLRYKDSFSSLAMAMEVLFQFLTLDNWGDILKDLIVAVDPIFAHIYVLLWVWLGAFIFRNVFVGVMVSNFDRISNELREQFEAKRRQRMLDAKRKRLKKELGLQLATGQGSIADLRVAGAAALDAIEIAESTANLASQPPKAPTVKAEGDKSPQKLSFSLDSSRPVPLPPITPGVHPRTDRFTANGDNDGETPEMKAARLAADAASSELVAKIQAALADARGVSLEWERTIRDTLLALGASGGRGTTMWPRDTLFRYFQLMENLQENVKEYQELQQMVNVALLELSD